MLLLGFPVLALAHWSNYCLTDDQTSDIISRWTSLAIDINLQVVDETVTDDFQFFSDSQDFLEGLPVSRINCPSLHLQAMLIHDLRCTVWFCKRGTIHREQDGPDSATNRRPGPRHASHSPVIHHPQHVPQLPRHYVSLALPRQIWGRSPRLVSLCSVLKER